ncbi:MAG TPA: type 2 lanthipeptide synthetase LanM [Thermoanaerobaculia bacterium]
MNHLDGGRIRDIVARATPLWDRLPGSPNRQSEPDSVKARDRLDRWRETLGSAGLLARRLQNSTFSSVDLSDLLGGLQAGSELPDWASTFASVLTLHLSSSEPVRRDSIDRSYDSAAPLPFEEVLVSFVRFARQRLEAETGSAFEVLRPSAHLVLERQLLAHLTFVASLALGQDFYSFRFERAPASAFESIWCRQAVSREIYSAYLRHMHDGGLLDLFDTYPVLARLLSQSVEQWIRIAVDLCRRFSRDFFHLRAFFGWKVDRPEGAVVGVRADLSDRHQGGQTVLECILCTDEHVVYKPRTVLPEIAFYKFIEWLNSCGLSLDLRVLRALDRETYGWVEAVAPVPCRSPNEIERFYARSGMLLGALHILATTDIHCENLIASGEHPVVVDLETLLNEGALKGGLEDESGHHEQSVLNVGLLPCWERMEDGHRFDMSALGADGTQDPGIRFPAWRFTNTDQMTLSKDAPPEASTNHRVRISGEDELPSVRSYMPSFLSGFREVYLCLMAWREWLLAENSLLEEFDGLELRVMVRSTMNYTRLQLHLLHPEFLKDGLDRSIEIEWLARPLCWPSSPDAGRRWIYELERTAMESLDVPHFGTSAWKSMVREAEEDLVLLGAERDSRVLRRRLASLSSRDCERQLAVMEEAVRSRFKRSQPHTRRAHIETLKRHGAPRGVIDE